jgi:molybdate transport system ATP-binding protein
MPALHTGRYVDIELQHVQLHRAGRRVLRDVSWRIRPGERWILAGDNGAGKTQLLKLISGAVWPTPGGRAVRRYRWRGELFESPHEVQEEIAYLGAERQDKYERYGWNYTVEQVVGTGVARTDIPLASLSSGARVRIARTLRALAIEQLAMRTFLSLSYGERRLTLLARALVSRPGILLLDELFNGLDAARREGAYAWLERSARSHLPWVLATHRREDVPASASHALVLEHGRVVYRGAYARAPLERWLGPLRRPAARKRQARARAAGRMLVRLAHAGVYVDERAILKNISLEVRTGQCWVVHGPNGSGKTTLLRTLYGDHGVALGGRVERAGMKPGMPLEVFRRQVGLVAPHLQAEHPQELNVATVVQSGRYAAIGLNAPADSKTRAAARRALKSFGLARLASRSLRELSYGQLRRVLFARAWINEPRLLLLDEPFAGIDVRTRRILQRQIQDLAASGTAIVMATHHRGEWPSGTTHELELAAGRIRYAGRLR